MNSETIAIFVMALILLAVGTYTEKGTLHLQGLFVDRAHLPQIGPVVERPNTTAGSDGEVRLCAQSESVEFQDFGRRRLR